MKLFIAHCGYYDPRVGSALYEAHTSYLIAAEDAAAARARTRELAEFRELRMHIDNLQEIEAVQGHEVKLVFKPALKGKTRVRGQKIGSRKAVLSEI